MIRVIKVLHPPTIPPPPTYRIEGLSERQFAALRALVAKTPANQVNINADEWFALYTGLLKDS